MSEAPTITKVSIERDYTQGLVPRFSVNEFPGPLEDRMTRDDFRRIVEGVNGFIERAEEVRCSTVAEGCVGCLTCFISPAICPTQYERSLTSMSRFLHEQNEFLYDYGIEFVNPVNNGLLHLDIIVRPRVRPAPTIELPPSSSTSTTTKPT